MLTGDFGEFSGPSGVSVSIVSRERFLHVHPVSFRPILSCMNIGSELMYQKSFHFADLYNGYDIVLTHFHSASGENELLVCFFSEIGIVRRAFLP